ncbi:YpmS family protein [Secundilactobacillus yichangensis]|uniref:YpmS family protein n=1 Tax=Secundilactobacillus yichangensis TaxID=2799580 RepID=UPI0019446C57|nr:YpmS family protein [Secundilactobacillus yichangensis]
MNTESRQAHTVAKKKQVNPWKWAFIALIAILLLGIGTVGIKLFSAPKDNAVQTSAPASAANFNVNLNKKQLNAMAAYYLNQFQNESNQKVDYQFEVHDDAVLTGQTQLLGLPVHFGLSLTPTVLANGNVQLKAKKLAVGQLNVPVSAVLSYIKAQYNLPKWIELDVHQKTITMNLQQFRTNGVQYRAEKIDMNGAGHFEFKVLVPKPKS